LKQYKRILTSVAAQILSIKKHRLAKKKQEDLLNNIRRLSNIDKKKKGLA
jgi:hypothetical protein